MNAANIQPYSRAVVKLLKGIVEKDDVVWNDYSTTKARFRTISV